jgi:hypothetical protein
MHLLFLNPALFRIAALKKKKRRHNLVPPHVLRLVNANLGCSARLWLAASLPCVWRTALGCCEHRQSARSDLTGKNK